MRRSISVWDHEIPRLLEFGKDQPHQDQIECQDGKHDVAPSDFKSLIRWTQLVGIGPSGFQGNTGTAQIITFARYPRSFFMVSPPFLKK